MVVICRWFSFPLITSYIVAAIHVHSFFPPSKQVIVLTLYTIAGPFAGLVAYWIPMTTTGSWLYGILGLFFCFCIRLSHVN